MTKKELAKQILSSRDGARKMAASVVNPFRINPEGTIKELRELVPTEQLKKVVILAAAQLGSEDILKHFPEFF